MLGVCIKQGSDVIFMMNIQDRLAVIEDLLEKLNALETNFTIVDETVPLISPSTWVRKDYYIAKL